MTPPPITSPANPALRELRQLIERRDRRERAGRFVVEGEDLVEAAAQAGWIPVSGFRAARQATVHPATEGFTEVEPELLDRLSRRGSGTRTLAVFSERWAPQPQGPRCVYLHAVRDPGNVGSVLRSALALGASSVALGPDCADPFGPKATAASMGAIFHVPVSRAPAPTAGTDHGLPGPLVALAVGEGEPLWALTTSGPMPREAIAPGAITLLIGAERLGLPTEVLANADRRVEIPLAAGDSLNAAVAAAVALYELRRADALAPDAPPPAPSTPVGRMAAR